MQIHDLDFAPIERIESASQAEVRQLMKSARHPLIFSGLQGDFEFLTNWNLEFLAKLGSSVPVQAPEADGVNYFFKYEPMPIKEFVSRIKGGDNLYIGARQFLGSAGMFSDIHGLGKLRESFEFPLWIDVPRVQSGNLWVGAGENRTLLHYDPWDSVQILKEGQKRFYVIPPTHSDKLYQHSIFNFRALYLGKVLHSKIRPLNVQKHYEKKFREASGMSGTIGPGDVIYIPAGFWHYVESEGQNIGVNFFVHSADRTIHRYEPLRTYWIKDNIALAPIRLLYWMRARLFKLLRTVLPKKDARS